MSRHEKLRPNSSKTGCVSPTIQAIEPSSASRVISANAKPDLARPVLAFRRQPSGKNGDEHQIVDAENDFERGERQQAGPDLGIAQPIHVSLS